MCPNIIEIAKEAFELPEHADTERLLRNFLRAIAKTVAEGVADPQFSLRLHPVGTFKSERRPARKRVNPRTGQLLFTPEQVRLTFELSRRLNKAGKPKASKLG